MEGREDEWWRRGWRGERMNEGEEDEWRIRGWRGERMNGGEEDGGERG